MCDGPLDSHLDDTRRQLAQRLTGGYAHADTHPRGLLDHLQDNIAMISRRHDPIHQQSESSDKNPGLSTNGVYPAGRTAPDPQSYEWPEYTALDLAGVFNLDGIPALLLGLEMAKNQGNERIPQFIEGLVRAKEQYPEMPASWRASVLGFPFIAEAISAPAFGSLAELIKLTHPYLGRKLRRDYHKRARPILREVWEQVGWWAAPSGYALMPRAQIPAVHVDTLEELMSNQISESELSAQNHAIEDALVKGKVALFRAEGVQRRVEETPEGLILDIVSRLPDVDRQHGKVFGRRLSMTAVLMSWCQIYPEAYERYRASHADTLHERDQEKKDE